MEEKTVSEENGITDRFIFDRDDLKKHYEYIGCH